LPTDNRIPPRGYRIAEAAARMCVPVDMGVEDPDYFTSAEYAGGYDEVTLPGVLPPGAARVEVALYYQTTSREYVEFLRDEINGTGVTLSSPAPSGEAQAYIAQSDPFFAQLNAWGDTIWQLWKHNKDIHGASPYLMTEAYWGAAPPTPGCTPPAAPTLIAATPGKGKVTLEWSDVHSADPEVVGYRIYYDQGGKAQLVAELGLVTTYTDRSLTAGQDYCYVVTAVDGPECESDPSGVLCAVPSGGGGGGGGRPR
jgi:hypothetical protein